MSPMTVTALALIVAGFVTVTPDPAMSRFAIPARQERPAPVGGMVDAGIGNCSTDIAVRDAAGQPIHGATVQMRIRYGLMGLRQMELAVGTGADGHARIHGLPESAALLLFDIGKGNVSTQLNQDLSRACRGRYAVTLK
jgi:hypothetical protein